MLKITVTVFICFIGTTTLLANKIDSINTVQQVEQFLQQIDSKLNRFSVGTIKTLYQEGWQQQLAKKLNVQAWQKIDFNQDKLTDLFVYGLLDQHPYLLVVIDEGNSFKIWSPQKMIVNNILYFPVIDLGQPGVMLVLHHIEDNLDSYKGNRIRKDSLVYKLGDFIEPNFNITRHNIKKIEYATSRCFGTCPVFDVTIQSDRSSTYHAIEFTDIKGVFSTKIDSGSYHKMLELLLYIDFANLKNQYAVNFTDAPSCTLIITYDQGKIKTIHDYGKNGSLGLRLLYTQLFDLTKNQVWVKE